MKFKMYVIIYCYSDYQCCISHDDYCTVSKVNSSVLEFSWEDNLYIFRRGCLRMKVRTEI